MKFINKIKNEDLRQKFLTNEAMNPVLVVKILEHVCQNIDDNEEVSIHELLRGDYHNVVMNVLRELSERYFAEKRRKIRSKDPLSQEITLEYGFIKRVYFRIEGNLYEEKEEYYSPDRVVNGRILKDISAQLSHCQMSKAS